MNSLPKKSLGQHWLRDQSILQAICEAGDVQPDDTVLEIGPGLGTLTRVLAAQAKNVIAIEFDAALAEKLQAETLDNVEIELGDIRTYDFTKIKAPYKVVANIPYYLTSHLIRVLSESSNPPEKAALLIQKEVAERVAAVPGDMSLLSATTQLFWDVQLDIAVPAEFFEPPPKVDSQVLVLSKPTEPKVGNTAPVLTVMKAGFSAPRKKLANNLAAGLRIEKQAAEKALYEVDIPVGARAQDLTIQSWTSLTHFLLG